MISLHNENGVKKSYRMTRARTSMIELFQNTKNPISAKALHTMLKRIGIPVNITTVYREIDFLLQQNMIEKVPLTDGELHYEMKGRPHHHHLLCSSCGTIEDISLESEGDLLEEALDKTSFKIKSHSLAFFGICPKCQ